MGVEATVVAEGRVGEGLGDRNRQSPPQPAGTHSLDCAAALARGGPWAESFKNPAIKVLLLLEK